MQSICKSMKYENDNVRNDKHFSTFEVEPSFQNRYKLLEECCPYTLSFPQMSEDFAC